MISIELFRQSWYGADEHLIVLMYDTAVGSDPDLGASIKILALALAMM